MRPERIEILIKQANMYMSHSSKIPEIHLTRNIPREDFRIDQDGTDRAALFGAPSEKTQKDFQVHIMAKLSQRKRRKIE